MPNKLEIFESYPVWAKRKFMFQIKALSTVDHNFKLGEIFCSCHIPNVIFQIITYFGYSTALLLTPKLKLYYVHILPIANIIPLRPY